MYFGGFCVSEVVNNILKRIFKQPRPERSKKSKQNRNKKDKIRSFSSRTNGSLSNSRNAEWSRSNIFLFYDLFSDICYSKVTFSIENIKKTSSFRSDLKCPDLHAFDPFEIVSLFLVNSLLRRSLRTAGKTFEFFCLEEIEFERLVFC